MISVWLKNILFLFAKLPGKVPGTFWQNVKLFTFSYVAALLSHQMDQLLKLNKELSEGKKEVDGIKNNIKDLEQELKAQELMMQSHAPKLVVSCKTCYFRLDNTRKMTLIKLQRFCTKIMTLLLSFQNYMNIWTFINIGLFVSAWRGEDAGGGHHGSEGGLRQHEQASDESYFRKR